MNEKNSKRKSEKACFLIFFDILKKTKNIFKKGLTNESIFVIIHSVVKQHGSVPERPKGADCKSVVTDFGGPNPPAPTKIRGTTLCGAPCFVEVRW